MYPNQPQQTPPPMQNPADYLNQIAPKPQKPSLLKPGPRLFIIIGIALVVIVSAVSIGINLFINAQRQPLQHLAARLETTEKIANEAQTNLKSSQLRSLNSNLKIYFTNTNRDIGTPLLASGVNVDKLPASVTKEESGDTISATLENARLNAVFDRTYAREMAYQLSTLLTLMEQIKASTTSQSMRTFLDGAITNLEPTQVSFANFDAASN